MLDYDLRRKIPHNEDSEYFQAISTASFRWTGIVAVDAFHG